MILIVLIKYCQTFEYDDHDDGNDSDNNLDHIVLSVW